MIQGLRWLREFSNPRRKLRACGPAKSRKRVCSSFDEDYRVCARVLRNRSIVMHDYCFQRTRVTTTRNIEAARYGAHLPILGRVSNKGCVHVSHKLRILKNFISLLDSDL
jgi:hypothetical protein